MVMVDRSNFLLSRCGILRIYLSMALLFAALPIVATAQTERRQKGSNGATVSVPPAPNAKTQREPIWVDEISTAKRGDGYFRRVLELPAIEEAFLEFEATEQLHQIEGLHPVPSRILAAISNPCYEVSPFGAYFFLC